MKFENNITFDKHLEGAAPNRFALVYFIISKEVFPREKAVKSLIKHVLPDPVSTQLSLQVFDADRQSPNQILQDLQTHTFFSKQRLVVVHRVDSLDKASTSKFETYFASPNPSVCLVMVAETINRSTNFYKKAEKAGVILDVPEEKPWEKEKNVINWLNQEVASHQKQLSPMASQLIVKQVGTDQTLLLGELQKLICYVGERRVIDEKDIAALCPVVNTETGWQLGEAIFRRDAATALRISKGLITEGLALIALLRQIRSQFLTGYQIASILKQGGTSTDVSKEFPYMKGTILERNINQSQNYGMDQFKKGILAIDLAEFQAKNSVSDPEFLADMLIVKLTKES